MYNLSDFLSRWDIDCYKDNEGNYYIEHTDIADYFHGEFIKCESIHDIIACMPDSLEEDDLNDITDDLGEEYLKETGYEIGIPFHDGSCDEVLAFLQKAKEFHPDHERLQHHIDCMQTWANAELNDDIKSTNLTVAVIKAMEAGICKVGVSEHGNDGIMCQFGDNEFYFHDSGDAETMEEFIENVCSGHNRNSYYDNDYEIYSENEMARDIANTIIDMCKTYDPNEGLYYLYLMEENLPEFYHECIHQYINIAKETEEYIKDNEEDKTI